MPPLIKLNQITKSYTVGENTLPVLKGIDFELARGEMTAIIGASGSGKSTLMNVIGLLDRPTSGSYIFADEEVGNLAELKLANMRNAKIGFVFQSFFLLPRMSALQNVMLPLFYRGMLEINAQRLAMSMLDKMQVAHLAAHKPAQLSGGQQQRVAIARALVGSPEMILADEPTGALDERTGQDVMRILLDLHQEGTTILLITHDKSISGQCSRIVKIQDGRLCEA